MSKKLSKKDSCVHEPHVRETGEPVVLDLDSEGSLFAEPWVVCCKCGSLIVYNKEKKAWATLYS